MPLADTKPKTMEAEKCTLRAEAAARRRECPESEIARLSAQITARIIVLEQYTRAEVVFAYIALHKEVQTRFVRLGRSLIVNHRYLYKIDIMKQLVILTDGSKEEIRLNLPKPIVKTYKKAIAMSMEKKGGLV